MRGDFAAAVGLGEAAIAGGFEEARTARASAYTSLGVALSASDITRTIDVYRDGARRCEALGDDFGDSACRAQAGLFSALVGDQDSAREDVDVALERARRCASPTAMAIALFANALVWWRDAPERARTSLEECTRLTEAGATEVLYAEALELLARLQAAAGDLDQALRTLRTSFIDAANRSYISSVSSNLCYLAEILGLANTEPELVARVHGMRTHGALKDIFPMIAGEEAERYEQAIANARAALDERFDSFVQAGAAMREEECLRFGASELDRLVASHPAGS
jgi:tetratricopeptide (TPR) repeat protein